MGRITWGLAAGVKWVLLCAVFLCSCGHRVEYRTITGFAQGSTYQITWADRGAMPQAAVRDSIEGLLASFDRSLSLYDSTSLLCAWNENRTERIDGWFSECLALYDTIFIQSGGFVDPTLRPLIAMYGFGVSKGVPRSPSLAQIDSIRAFVGLDRVLELRGDTLLKKDPRVELDFNAVAQGYSVDLAARLLERLGAADYMVEIGGEVFARGVNSKGGGLADWD